MSSFIHAGANKFRRAREWATPTLKDSAFLTRGVLTPEEFIKAGDELVYKCPTWSWASGDEKKRKNYLPSDKQVSSKYESVVMRTIKYLVKIDFLNLLIESYSMSSNNQYLVTRNVPCPTRVSVLENSVAIGEEDTAHIEEECGGDDWLVSKMITPEEHQRRMDQKIEEEFDILDIDEGSDDKKNEVGVDGDGVEKSMEKMTIDGDEKNEDEEKDKNVTSEETDVVADTLKHNEEDEYADMEEFEDENVIEDEAAVSNSVVSTSKTTSKFDNNIMKVRTYDLSITYDKYYQTPRVWMMGYESSDSSQPLTGEQMLQDVMSDYANRTVTIDPHPHVSGYHASIHPCQHGAVMKTIVRNLTKAAEDVGGREGEVKAPSVEMYLFIFLKFVSSIIPTINYDFTMEVTASTEK